MVFTFLNGCKKIKSRIFHCVKIIWNENFSDHKVFLELSHIHSSLHCLLFFHATVALVVAAETVWPRQTVYCLALYRKALLTMVCRNQMNLSNQGQSWMHGFLWVRLGTPGPGRCLSNLRASRTGGWLGHHQRPLHPIENRLMLNFCVKLRWWSPKGISLLTKQMTFFAVTWQPFHTKS